MVVRVAKLVFTTRFQTREFIEQAWFITSVTLMPTILVSVPFGAVISLQVGNLTGQLGAPSFADHAVLGARQLREEIGAREVLGIDPVERLVVPRVLATLFVALMINGI